MGYQAIALAGLIVTPGSQDGCRRRRCGRERRGDRAVRRLALAGEPAVLSDHRPLSRRIQRVLLTELDSHSGPELVVVAGVVDMVEEQPALADEEHRVLLAFP